jgi:hypothetical protein
LKKIKTIIKINGISKQNLCFSTTSAYNSSYFSQNYVYKNFISSSPNLPSLGNPKSHHHDSKPTRIQKFKTTMFHEQSLSQMPCSSKSCNHATPLTFPFANQATYSTANLIVYEIVVGHGLLYVPLFH